VRESHRASPLGVSRPQMSIGRSPFRTPLGGGLCRRSVGDGVGGVSHLLMSITPICPNLP